MSTSSHSDETQARVILGAYKQLVVNNLYDEMIAELKPKVLKAAQAAADELAPTISTYVDSMYNTLHVQIAVKSVEKSSDR